MAEEMIIRQFRKADLEAIVDLSLRAWEPVFASVRQVLGDDIFLRLHPSWKEDQAEAVDPRAPTRNGMCSSRSWTDGRSVSSRSP